MIPEDMKVGMNWRNSFIVSNVLDVPWRVPDQVFQLMITSPPYWGLRTYGTETWEGGDPKCQHTVIRRSGDQSKAATNRGSSRDRISNTCRLCGAKRIDQQIGLEKTPDCGMREFVRLRKDLTQDQIEYVAQRLRGGGHHDDD